MNIDPDAIVEDAVRRNQIATDVPGYIPGPGSIFVFERSLIPRWTDAGFFPYSESDPHFALEMIPRDLGAIKITI